MWKDFAQLTPNRNWPGLYSVGKAIKWTVSTARDQSLGCGASLGKGGKQREQVKMVFLMEWEGWSLSDWNPLSSIKRNLCVERVVGKFRGEVGMCSWPETERKHGPIRIWSCASEFCLGSRWAWWAREEKPSEISMADRISPTGSDLGNDLLKNWKHGPQNAEQKKESGRECKNRNKQVGGKC